MGKTWLQSREHDIVVWEVETLDVVYCQQFNHEHGRYDMARTFHGWDALNEFLIQQGITEYWHSYHKGNNEGEIRKV